MLLIINERYFKWCTLVVVVITVAISAVIINERHSLRKVRYQILDAQLLEQKIQLVEKNTNALKEADELNPVWENWKLAKETASAAGLTMSASKETKNSRQVWIGTLSGDPLLVLAVAGKIQQKVAAQLIKMDYMGSSARLEIAILGTDSVQHEIQK